MITFKNARHKNLSGAFGIDEKRFAEISEQVRKILTEDTNIEYTLIEMIEKTLTIAKTETEEHLILVFTAMKMGQLKIMIDVAPFLMNLKKILKGSMKKDDNPFGKPSKSGKAVVN